jgi:hypothetical protein
MISLAVLLIFLLGFLAGQGVETCSSMTRGKRQAAQQRKLNEMWRTLHGQQGPNELRHAASARAVAPYVYVTDHEEVD